MNNSDSPAAPQSGTEGASGDLNSSNDWGGSGLTKREHFAGLAMQGILSSARINADEISSQRMAATSLKLADALLEELAK